MAGRLWRGALQLGKQMTNIHLEKPMEQMFRPLYATPAVKPMEQMFRPYTTAAIKPMEQIFMPLYATPAVKPMEQMFRPYTTDVVKPMEPDYIRPGFNFDHPPFGAFYGVDVPNGDDDLPVRVDWTLVPGAVMPPQDQCETGLCYNFASLGAVGSVNFLKTGEEAVPLSNQQVVDCGTLMGCGIGGGWPEVVFDFVIRSNGILPASVYPFTGVQGKCKRVKAAGVKIDDWEYILPNNEAALKYAVAHQPVVVGICVGKRILVGDTITQFDVYGGGVMRGPSYKNLDHCALLVGYGETKLGVLYWHLMNSSGDSWGEDGYFYIRRDTRQQGGALGILREPLVPLKLKRRRKLKQIVLSKCESCARCF